MPSNGMPSVCVVGSLNMDLVVRAPRLPAPGETISGGPFRSYHGGKGANQAVAAARMGAKVSIIGAIGNEPHGMELASLLNAEGIHTHLLVRSDGTPTGVGIIVVADDGENTIVVAPGANMTLTPDEVESAGDLIRGSDVLLLQLEVPMDTVIAAARIGREAGKSVVLNAAPGKPVPPQLLKLIDVLVVNRHEGGVLAQMDPNGDSGRLAMRLSELGPSAVVLTLGSLGSIIAYRGRPKRLPALRVTSVDGVGAGDAFCGALAVGWAAVHQAAQWKSPDEFKLVDAALMEASAAGALATLTHGAIASLPRRTQVLEAAGELEKMVKSGW